MVLSGLYFAHTSSADFHASARPDINKIKQVVQMRVLRGVMVFSLCGNSTKGVVVRTNLSDARPC
jgi:hypothetical protein